MAAIAEVENTKWLAETTIQTRDSRANAIKQQINQINVESKRQVENDPMLHDLQRLLAARIKNAESLRWDDFPHSSVEQSPKYLAAMSEVTEVRMRIDARTEAIERQAYGDGVRELNREMIQCSLDRDEQAALVSSCSSRLAVLRNALDQSQRLAQISKEIEQMNQQFQAMGG